MISWHLLYSDAQRKWRQKDCYYSFPCGDGLLAYKISIRIIKTDKDTLFTNIKLLSNKATKMECTMNYLHTGNILVICGISMLTMVPKRDFRVYIWNAITLLTAHTCLHSDPEQKCRETHTYSTDPMQKCRSIRK